MTKDNKQVNMKCGVCGLFLSDHRFKPEYGGLVPYCLNLQTSFKEAPQVNTETLEELAATSKERGKITDPMEVFEHIQVFLLVKHLQQIN